MLFSLLYGCLIPLKDLKMSFMCSGMHFQVHSNYTRMRYYDIHFILQQQKKCPKMQLWTHQIFCKIKVTQQFVLKCL